MPKLKPISPRELVKVVEFLGFQFMRQKGSHATFKHPDGRIVVVPMHAGNEIDRGLLLKIIKKELKISREEFEKIVNG